MPNSSTYLGSTLLYSVLALEPVDATLGKNGQKPAKGANPFQSRERKVKFHTIPFFSTPDALVTDLISLWDSYYILLVSFYVLRTWLGCPQNYAGQKCGLHPICILQTVANSKGHFLSLEVTLTWEASIFCTSLWIFHLRSFNAARNIYCFP